MKTTQVSKQRGTLKTILLAGAASFALHTNPITLGTTHKLRIKILYT